LDDGEKPTCKGFVLYWHSEDFFIHYSQISQVVSKKTSCNY